MTVYGVFYMYKITYHQRVDVPLHIPCVVQNLDNVFVLLLDISSDVLNSRNVDHATSALYGRARVLEENTHAHG